MDNARTSNSHLTGALQMFLLSSGKLRPLNGSSKVEASIIMHPSAQMSAGAWYGLPCMRTTYSFEVSRTHSVQLDLTKTSAALRVGPISTKIL